MAHLRLVEEQDATGEVRREYDAAVERAGKVMNVIKAMSLSPGVLPHFLALNTAVNFAPSELDRVDRELLAIAVSDANGARYSSLAHREMLRDLGDPGALDARRRALVAFAEKLTRKPAGTGAAEVEELRAHGLSDAAISDAIQVVAFFNYVNRVVNAVGIGDEPEWTAAGSD